jgi:hypothetical protein
MFARLILILAMAGLLAGCDSEASEQGQRYGDRPGFPVNGTWVWSNGGRWLPSRNVGCTAAAARLSIGPHSIDVIQGDWRHPAFLVNDWEMLSATKIQLRLEDNTSVGRRRMTVSLDISDNGFVRFAGASDLSGRRLDLAKPIGGKTREEPDESEALAGAFTLVRCADETVDMATMLRGAADDKTPRGTWVLR